MVGRLESLTAVGGAPSMILDSIEGIGECHTVTSIAVLSRCYDIGRRVRRGSSPLGSAARACGFDSCRLHSLTSSWVANQMMSREGCHFLAIAFPLAPKIRG